MSETKMVWHPYPETSPDKDGEYLVTYDDERVCFDNYEDGYFEVAFYLECDVLAWMEIPEPYKPEPVDNHSDAVTAQKYMSDDPETVKALHLFDE